MASKPPSSLEKRTATNKDSDRPAKKPKLTTDTIKEDGVFLVYKNYLKNKVDAPDPGLINYIDLCHRFNWIPSIGQVSFVIEQANLIDKDHRLEFPVYPFMQEFKFLMYVAEDTHQPRMLVGKIPFTQGEQEVWAGWSKADDDPHTGQPATTAKLVLYYLPAPDGDDDGVFDLEPYSRKWIKWEESLETLFGMSRILDMSSLGPSIVLQNAILMSVAKVVIRFPGLMRPFDDQADSLAAQLHRATFSSRPFDELEPMLEESPYWVTYELINSGPDASVGVHRCHPPDSPNFTPNSTTA